MAFGRKPAQFWMLVWGAAALALVAVLVLEHEFGRSGIGEGARAPAKVADARLLPAFKLAQSEGASETLARPLFVPGRRPSPPAAEGTGSIKRGQFILQGTTLVGPLKIALLKEVASGEIHRVEKGGKILGMTVAEVSPEEVVLRSGDDSETLPLVVAKGVGSAAAAVEHGPFGPATKAAAPPAAPGGAPVPAAATPTPVRPATGNARTRVPAIPMPATPVGQAELTPEEMIARRRAARRAQQTNQKN